MSVGHLKSYLLEFDRLIPEYSGLYEVALVAPPLAARPQGRPLGYPRLNVPQHLQYSNVGNNICDGNFLE